MKEDVKKVIGDFEVEVSRSSIFIDNTTKSYSDFNFDKKYTKKIFNAINKAISTNRSIDLTIGEDEISIIANHNNNTIFLAYNGSQYDDVSVEIPIKDMKAIMKFVLASMEIKGKQTSEGIMPKEKSIFSEDFDQVEEYFKRNTKAPVKVSKEQINEQAEVLTAFECAMTDMRDMVSQNPMVVSQNAAAMNGILQRLYDVIREIETIKANV